MRKAIASNLPDLMLIAGSASVSAGAWMIYEPFGFIVAGLLLGLAGFVTAKAGK